MIFSLAALTACAAILTEHFQERVEERGPLLTPKRAYRAAALYEFLGQQKATFPEDGRWTVQFSGVRGQVGDYFVVDVRDGQVETFVSLLVDQDWGGTMGRGGVVTAKRVGLDLRIVDAQYATEVRRARWRRTITIDLRYDNEETMVLIASIVRAWFQQPGPKDRKKILDMYRHTLRVFFSKNFRSAYEALTWTISVVWPTTPALLSEFAQRTVPQYDPSMVYIFAGCRDDQTVFGAQTNPQEDDDILVLPSAGLLDLIVRN